MLSINQRFPTSFNIFFKNEKLPIMGHYLELGLIIFIMMGGPVSSLTGIQFGDNGGQNYVTEENGVAMATTQVF